MMVCYFRHKWNGCKCDKCGKTRYDGHIFTAIPNQCLKQCKKCGEIHKIAHDFQKAQNYDPKGYDMKKDWGDITLLETCIVCHAIKVKYAGYATCTACNGKGSVEVENISYVTGTSCGWIEEQCNNCEGTGIQPEVIIHDRIV